MTHEAVSENVATTGDIAGLTAALTADIASLEARMMARMTLGFIGLAGLNVAGMAITIAVAVLG